jgi:putative ABC transport system permease protein
MLAEDLSVTAGDTLTLELLEGRRDTVGVVVAGTVDDLLGVSGTMSLDGLRRLTGGPELASGAYLSVEVAHLPEVNARLKDMPLVAGVGSPAAALASFESQLAEGLLMGIGFLLSFAGIISVAVIYNGARISLSERGRELASLQVMGFRRAEVSALLLGEQAILTLAAIPMGWALGYGLAIAVTAALQTELYRIPLVISAQTYAVSALIVLVAATLSGLVVRRRVDRLDLIEVLKTRE